MAEDSYEASLLPHIPCMDRWADRAEAMATCGAAGAYVRTIGGLYDASSAAEINKFFWWDPAPDKEQLLQKLAQRQLASQDLPAVCHSLAQ